MKAIIYHNPRCSKSRQTLALLEEKGVVLEIIEYLKTPPNQQTLKEIINKLDIAPIDLMRKSEPVYKKLNINKESKDIQSLLDVMVENPILIERPIVVANGKAVIGRPPESVLDIVMI
ncbi:arsenate reductase (glutaredoxin) [Gammaproteobacteria bacterium]|jgi:arsenate reductase|nr:arsenate reductase (glutaredoxin) [Gammaproteobacteria bacterium]|tara:strand:+ start:37 stop:390 length:354 start_codon:yes stop_codon:yes gene_type:complete